MLGGSLYFIKWDIMWLNDNEIYVCNIAASGKTSIIFWTDKLVDLFDGKNHHALFLDEGENLYRSRTRLLTVNQLQNFVHRTLLAGFLQRAPSTPSVLGKNPLAVTGISSHCSSSIHRNCYCIWTWVCAGRWGVCCLFCQHRTLGNDDGSSWRCTRSWLHHQGCPPCTGWWHTSWHRCSPASEWACSLSAGALCCCSLSCLRKLSGGWWSGIGSRGHGTCCRRDRSMVVECTQVMGHIWPQNLRLRHQKWMPECCLQKLRR